MVMRRERKNDMKKRMTKFICLLLVLVLAMSVLAACGNKEGGKSGAVNKPAADREGNPIEVPAEINKIASFAPSINQVLESFGLLDKVVAIDTNTPMYVDGLDGVAQFNMMEPDVEKIAELEPDIVFTTGMSYQDNDPYAALKEMGICVIVIPSSSSIEAIKEDITFIAECFDSATVKKAEEINKEFQAEIDKIAAIGSTVTEKKKVMFEIAALPYLYSFGKGTFLDEMLSIIGAENVFGDQEAWIPVTEEDAVAANPDVILTSVNYIEDAVGEILGRPGWENVNAVKNKEVYYINNGASSLPNQYIIKALQQMAEAVYPDIYEYEDVMEPAA
jgi:iron complex transport system substrate-binding protein